MKVIDDFDRETWAMEVDLSLLSELIIPVLQRIIEWPDRPKIIRCDNGPKYISSKFMNWAKKHQITIVYIQSGNPQQNAYLKKINRMVHYDWLSNDIFTTSKWRRKKQHDGPEITIMNALKNGKITLLMLDYFTQTVSVEKGTHKSFAASPMETVFSADKLLHS